MDCSFYVVEQLQMIVSYRFNKKCAAFSILKNRFILLFLTLFFTYTYFLVETSSINKQPEHILRLLMANVLQSPRSFKVSSNNFTLNYFVGGNSNDGNKVNCDDDILSPYSSDGECNQSDSIVSAHTDESRGTSDTSSTSSDHEVEILKSTSPEPSFISLSEMYQIDLELSRQVGKEVYNISEYGSVASFIQSRIEAGIENGSFLITNLNSVLKQFNQWKQELPMVEPFYAVKCNPDPAIVRLLASLGCSFDCATMGEVDLVLHGLGNDLSFANLNKAATSVVYANPAKMEHMLKYAIDNNVKMTVFDGEDELHKIASLPGGKNMQLLLRLTTDDKSSICRFSKKFGCPVAEAPKLLEVAKSLGLHVAGVSFHVGSGCGDANAYKTALDHARKVFDCAESYGMTPMTIVDLGGGFPGDTGGYGGPGMPTFQQLATAIREGIVDFMKVEKRSSDKVRFIAEPGRYFVSASTVISTKIYSRKGGNNKYQALYVDDGVYGSFNNVVYDHANPIPMLLADAVAATKGEVETKELLPSAVFGPTCDGLDQMCSLESTNLPRCEVGEWLIWDNMGAYTHTASFVFNGYTHIPSKSYCFI